MRCRGGESADPTEVELKFHLAVGSQAALEATPIFAAAKVTQHHLVTTYFDTIDNLLDRVGLTLRVRRSGNTRTQTVKSRICGRGIATSRREWEWRIDQDEPDVGRLAATRALAGTARVLKSKLRPVFVTDIRRTTRLLHIDSKTMVEAAIDVGSITAGSSCEAVTELELELKCGSIGPMYRLASELQGLVPMWLSPESKAARGWHLLTGQAEGARLSQMPQLGPRVQAAAAFREILGGTLGHLVANIGPTLRGDPGALHQMRIAIRESRAALQLFELHLDAAAAARFNADLQHFGKIFGSARDWDVFCLETLSSAMPDLLTERLEDLNSAAEVERQFAHAAVADTLKARAFTRVVLDLATWMQTGMVHPSQAASERLTLLAPSLLDRAARKAKHRGRHVDRLSVTELHCLRKSLKKLWFSAESLGGLYGRSAARTYCGRCAALEEVLGKVNDAVVTKHLASALVTATRPELAKPAMALTRWSDLRGRKALQGIKAALKEFRATRPFWS